MLNYFDRSFIEECPIGYAELRMIKDRFGNPEDFSFMDMNGAFVKSTGLDRVQVMGSTLKNLQLRLHYLPDDFFEKLTKVALEGGTDSFLHYSKPLDHWFKHKIYSPEKHIVSLLLIDITPSMRHYEKLEEFFNISPDIMAIANLEGRFIKVNPAWEKVLGYRVEEVENQLYKDFVHPSYLQKDNNMLNRLQNDHKILNHVNMFRHKNGNYRYLEWSLQHKPKNKVYCIARDITERINSEKEIQYLTYHDHLTGLFNRQFAEVEMQRLDASRNLPIAIVIADINRLKLVNDAFGHEKGDAFIQEAAKLLTLSCRPEDLLARWGGDEFILFLPKTSHRKAESIVRRVKANCMNREIKGIQVSLSFGIAVKESEMQKMNDLLSEAERNLHQAQAREYLRRRSDIVHSVMETFYKKHPQEELHSKRVGALCKRTAQVLGWSDHDINLMEMAGRMHDIGKVALPDHILEKSGPLSHGEWDDMRRHTEVGSELVGAGQQDSEIGNAILYHHERIDGTGYPKGIKGSDIPIHAKILNIAASYDAMVHSHYKEELTLQEAADEIRKNAGSQFDPNLAETFIQEVLRVH